MCVYRTTDQSLKYIFVFQNLQKEQQNKIRDLEKEVMAVRGKHSESIQSLKSRFLKDKYKYQQDSEAKIASMSKQANKVSDLKCPFPLPPALILALIQNPALKRLVNVDTAVSPMK